MTDGTYLNQYAWENPRQALEGWQKSNSPLHPKVEMMQLLVKATCQ